jgi:hypothetical protein
MFGLNFDGIVTRDALTMSEFSVSRLAFAAPLVQKDRSPAETGTALRESA